MDGSIDDGTVAVGDGSGTTRRGVLLGATTLAAATAVASAIGGSPVSAAPPGGTFTCNMPGIGQFPISSIQWGAGVGVGSPGSGSGRETSAPSVSEVTISKAADTASPKLFRALVTSEHIDPVTITAVGKLGSPVITFVLSDVIVSGYSTSSGGEAAFSDSVSLNFTKVVFSFDDVSAGYDLVAAQPV